MDSPDLKCLVDNWLFALADSRSSEPELSARLYANGLSVRHVMIDGEWKIRDGQVMFDDEAGLKSRGGAAAKKIWDRLEKDGFFVKIPH